MLEPRLATLATLLGRLGLNLLLLDGRVLGDLDDLGTRRDLVGDLDLAEVVIASGRELLPERLARHPGLPLRVRVGRDLSLRVLRLVDRLLALGLVDREADLEEEVLQLRH